MAESSSEVPYRVLTLDGGGAKGFYSLGALREIEGLVGMPLFQKFDLIFGTSTGAIIAAMLALGHSVDEVHALYKEHVVSVMACKKPADKTARLKALAADVFKERTFEDVRTGIGIVTTKWINDRPMVFKASKEQAHGRQGTFKPGFGCTIADAVQASCSAYPFFEKKTVSTPLGDFELVDGGFCANNPTLYALAAVTGPLGKARGDIRVVSVGVGEYPPKPPKPLSKMWFATRYVESVTLLQKVMEINTQSMDQLRAIMFKDVPTIRINESFPRPHMATDLFEHDLGIGDDVLDASPFAGQGVALLNFGDVPQLDQVVDDAANTISTAVETISKLFLLHDPVGAVDGADRRSYPM